MKKRDRTAREDGGVSPALGYGRRGFPNSGTSYDRQQWTSNACSSHGRAAPRIGLFCQRYGPSLGAEADRAAQRDRDYDSKENRRWCWKKNIESVIPVRDGMHIEPGRPPTCDEEKYRDRNVVKRCVGRLKERRRIATRFEKKAAHNEATARRQC
ncbi:transposase [Salinibacter ruber]